MREHGGHVVRAARVDRQVVGQRGPGGRRGVVGGQVAGGVAHAGLSKGRRFGRHCRGTVHDRWTAAFGFGVGMVIGASKFRDAPTTGQAWQGALVIGGCVAAAVAFARWYILVKFFY